MSLPEGGMTKIKENVFGELEIDEVSSDTGMSISFDLGLAFAGR